MSSLVINFSKSTIISINHDTKWEEEVSQKLGCMNMKLPVRYLGIPLGTNPRKNVVWEPIVQKISSRLKLWKPKLLSRARRL